MELCYWEHYCLSIGNELLINQFVGVIKREFAFGGVEILSKQGSVIYPHHSINRCLGHVDDHPKHLFVAE